MFLDGVEHKYVYGIDSDFVLTTVAFSKKKSNKVERVLWTVGLLLLNLMILGDGIIFKEKMMNISTNKSKNLKEENNYVSNITSK